MARFNRTKTIAVTDVVTAQDLHDLLDTASLLDASLGDVSPGLHSIYAGDATPNPSLYPFWFSTGSDPVFRVWARPWNCWVAIGPDRFEIPLRNGFGADVPRGYLVVASAASEFSIATSPSLNALGFAQADIPAGAYGPIASVGVAWVCHSSGASLSLSESNTNDGYSVATGYAESPQPAGTARCFKFPNNQVPTAFSGPLWGTWLNNSTNVSETVLAKLWGPRLCRGF